MTFYETALTALRGAQYAYGKTRYVRNVLKTYIKDTEYQYDPDAMEPYSGKSRAQLIEGLGESLGLGDNLPPAKGFDKYVASRISSADKFTTTKIGEDTLAKKLTVTKETPDNAAAAIKATKGQINEALLLTAEAKEARKAFKQDIADLKECLENPNFEYLPKGLIDYLFRIRDNAKDAIEAQQAAEKTKLEALFETPDFQVNLKKSLNLDGLGPEEVAEQIEAVKTDMLAELDAAHLKERGEFENSINEPIKNMLSNSRERVSLLAMLNQKEENRIAIEKLIAASSGDLSAGGASASRAKGGRYKDVDVGQLKTFLTATGRKVNGEGDSYTLALPNRLLSPLYYGNPKHNLKADIMMLPMALKARGFDSITMNISHPDKEYAKELARLAAETCAECGFKDITINVNGESYSDKKEAGTIRTKLFEGCTKRWDNSVKQAKQNAVDWDKALKASKTEEPENFKARVDAEIRPKRDAEARAAELARAEAMARDNEDRDRLDGGGMPPTI